MIDAHLEHRPMMVSLCIQTSVGGDDLHRMCSRPFTTIYNFGQNTSIATSVAT